MTSTTHHHMFSVPTSSSDTQMIASSTVPAAATVSETNASSGGELPTKVLKTVRVIFDYAPTSAEELEIKEGDTVDVFDMQPDGWWYGQSKGKKGYFPSNFVQDGDAAPAKSEPEQGSRENGASGTKCTATFDYDAVDENELSFKEGDVIDLISQAPDGWWFGSLRGRQGLFPSNYVQMQQ